MSRKRRPGGSSKAVRINKNGVDISSIEWTKLRANREYTIIDEYENDKFGLYVEWVGLGERESIVPRQYWKLYKVNAYNIVQTGDRPGSFVKRKIPDPTLVESFSNENEAVDYYKRVLMALGLARVEESYGGDSEFVVSCNKLAVEKEIVETRDKPHTTAKVVGSW